MRYRSCRWYVFHFSFLFFFSLVFFFLFSPSHLTGAELLPAGLQRRARFSAVRRLTLFFPDNFGDGDEDVTRLSYVGFKGEWMQLGRAPANIIYEAAARPSDHKVKGTSVNQIGSGIGGRGPGM